MTAIVTLFPLNGYSYTGKSFLPYINRLFKEKFYIDTTIETLYYRGMLRTIYESWVEKPFRSPLQVRNISSGLLFISLKLDLPQ